MRRILVGALQDLDKFPVGLFVDELELPLRGTVTQVEFFPAKHGGFGSFTCPTRSFRFGFQANSGFRGFIIASLES